MVHRPVDYKPKSIKVLVPASDHKYAEYTVYLDRKDKVTYSKKHGYYGEYFSDDDLQEDEEVVERIVAY